MGRCRKQNLLGLELVVAHDGSHALATAVHEGCRLDKQHSRPGCQLALARLIELPFSPETAREAIQHHEPDIVAGLSIIAARVTQADDNTNGRIHGIDN